MISPVLARTDLPVDVRVEAWLLAAAFDLAEGRSDRAHTALDRALRLAAPERLRRPVFEAPHRLRRFLRQATDLTDQHGWLGAASAQTPTSRLSAAPEVGAGAGASGRGHDEALVVEPLTEKETEVLRCLSALLSTEEIARTMFVSVNTVKTHIRGVLRKLSATRRNEAVRRARELGLI